MVDDSSGGGESSSSKSRVTPSYARLGDRQVFTVELRPGDTTFVSWKKLMKDANKADFGSAPALDDPPPANAHPNLVSRIAPVVQATENEGKDAPTLNRFSTVIEKIESLYMGKDSSDEEDLKDVPYDNQYDSEDSFIDDAELDEYFEFDNSEIKHDGFFVNRGKLECINDPTVVSNQQPKKRRRKDLMKVPEDSDYGPALNNRVKLGKSAEANEFEKPNAGDLQTKFLTSKSKNGTVCFDAWNQKYNDKNVYAQSKLYSGKPVSNVNELESSVRSKEKNGGCQLPDHNILDARISMQATTSHVHKRDGSSVRPKGSMLEKAICELEKMVTELRPPALENQEAHASVQAIKRRLPGEIKLKLAKVARLAASQGKISKELINRLMSILGHVIRLRTLKRNLKIMITMGLSVKQENDDRFQQIKKEVVEIIKTLVPSLETKVFEQQAVAPDDFQEIGHEGKGALKRKFSMDAILEDKICDLYDLFVDGLDEDAAPQVRKLYMELAALWPSGFMDNRGIKRAICRAKERRRAMYNRLKDQEKIKRKKMLASKMQETVRSNVGLVAEPQHMPARLSSNAGDPVMALTSKTILNSATTADRVPSPSMYAPNLERPKQEKQKAYGSNSIDEEVKRGTDGSSTKKKKKAKRRPEPEVDEAHIHAEKLHSQHSEGRQEYIKQASEVEPNNLQLNAAASSEQSYVTYN